VVNAINYTPEKGSITVQLQIQDQHLLMQVVDTGVGISPENLESLFQPFFRVNQDRNGTGLGLTICKNIVELHGGSIHVESEVGKGSTFTVRLSLNSHPSVV
jgi:signal transduction histidine kinase